MVNRRALLVFWSRSNWAACAASRWRPRRPRRQCWRYRADYAPRDSDPDAWDRVVDVNLKGACHGLRAAIPEMLKLRGGVR